MRIDKLSGSQPLVIRWPDGKPTAEVPFDWVNGTESDVVLHCVSLNSVPVREVVRKNVKENLGKTEDEVPLEVQERQFVEMFAAAIVGWENVEDENGPVPYSHEKAVEYLMKPEMRFMFEQVQQFVPERANFFRGADRQAAESGSATRKGQHKK